jgi:hypothetical protein
MKNKQSFRKSKRRDRDAEFREKKIKDPRKDKSDRDFSIYEELEEFDPHELLDGLNEADEEEEYDR